MSGRRVAVIAGGRTPFFKVGQTFMDLGPLKLASHAVIGLIERHGVDRAVLPPLEDWSESNANLV